MYYSFSVFFVELLRTFEESRAKTGWVYSTNSAVHMFCGPLGGWVISRWGPRAAVMLGGLLAGLGNIMTAFAPTLDLIFFTHGFVNGGCKYSLLYVSGNHICKLLISNRFSNI